MTIKRPTKPAKLSDLYLKLSEKYTSGQKDGRKRGVMGKKLADVATELRSKGL